MKYTDRLQPYVIRCYECTADGLLMACEPYIPISEEEFRESEDEIKSILKEISKNFFIGDIGFTDINYANWGRRKTDHKLGILDFAYIYSAGYQTFSCTCEDKPFLQYDQNYVNLICPICGRKWSFGDIRKRISKKQEAEEIGNIMDVSYNLHSSSESVDVHPEYTRSLYADQMKANEEDSEKKLRKMRNKYIRKHIDDVSDFNAYEVGDPTSFKELINQLSHQVKKS